MTPLGTSSNQTYTSGQKNALKEALASHAPFDVEALAKHVPALESLRTCAQDATWHPEGDVLTHTRSALEVAWSRPIAADDWETLTAAVLLHDIGKATTTFFEPTKQRLVSYGHESAGVPIARELLREAGWLGQQRDEVLKAILLHMRPRGLEKERGGTKSFVRLALESNLQLLLPVLEADRLGRTGENVQVEWEKTQASFHTRLEELKLWPTPFFEVSDETLKTVGFSSNDFAFARGTLRYQAWQGSVRDEATALHKLYELRKSLSGRTLFITSGVQGSGKSTWAKTSGYTVISTDDMRVELGLDPADPTHVQKLFPVVYARMKTLAQAGTSFVYDATNITPKRRATAIDLSRRYGYRVVGMSFDLPLQLAQARNRNRSQPVPDEIVGRYSQSLVPFLPYEVDEVRYPAEEA